MRTISMPDDLITLAEVAAMTSLSHDYLYHIYKTQIPHFMFGSTPRFSRKEVLAWIESKRVYTKKLLSSRAESYCITRK